MNVWWFAPSRRCAAREKANCMASASLPAATTPSAASKLPGPATRAEAREEKREIKAERKEEKRELKAERKAGKREAKQEARIQKREKKEEKHELKAERKAEKFLSKVEKDEDSVLAKVLKQEAKADKQEAKAEQKAEKFLAKTEKLASKAARRAARRASARNGSASRKWLKGPLPGRKRRRSRVERPQTAAKPGGVCSASDHALWDTSASAAFAADMGACGPSCVGVHACTYACVRRRQPAMSSACAEQYAVLAACTRSRCWRVCLTGTHAECGACGTRCNPEFFRATGLRPWRPGAGQLAGGADGAADDARFGASETPLLAQGWTLGTVAPLLVLLVLCGLLGGRPCYRRHGWRLLPCWRRTFASARKAKASPGHPRPTPATWTVMEGATIVREPTRLDPAQGWTQRRVVPQQHGGHPRSSVDDLRAELFGSSGGAMSRTVSFEAVL